MKTKVYLTIDTELSMGGAWSDPAVRPVPADRRIFCRIGGKDHGIGWLCDELSRHKFRATFFAEMFCSLIFGKDDTKGWCQYLLERGQDVQLHTHLNFYYFAKLQTSQGVAEPRTDDLAALSSPVRGALLREACELFHSATGYYPLAYRAGNWHANRELMADLATEGICLDSSFNPATRGGGSFDQSGLKPNVLQELDGIWELPLTVAKQRMPEPYLVNGMRPFDLASLSSWEIRKILTDAHQAGAEHVVAVLHSFSGVKAKDSQYRTMKPDGVVRSRVRDFMEFLAANRDRFDVSTCGDLAAQLDRAEAGDGGALPDLGFVHPFARKFVQVLNSLYWT